MGSPEGAKYNSTGQSPVKINPYISSPERATPIRKKVESIKTLHHYIEKYLLLLSNL